MVEVRGQRARRAAASAGAPRRPAARPAPRAPRRTRRSRRPGPRRRRAAPGAGACRRRARPSRRRTARAARPSQRPTTIRVPSAVPDAGDVSVERPAGSAVGLLLVTLGTPSRARPVARTGAAAPQNRTGCAAATAGSSAGQAGRGDAARRVRALPRRLAPTRPVAGRAGEAVPHQQRSHPLVEPARVLARHVGAPAVQLRVARAPAPGRARRSQARNSGFTGPRRCSGRTVTPVAPASASSPQQRVELRRGRRSATAAPARP